MALDKAKELGNTGLVLSYFKVTNFDYSQGDTIRVTIGYYMDKQHDLDGKDPVYTGSVEFNLEDMPTIISQIESAIKKLPEFSGAIDA